MIQELRYVNFFQAQGDARIGKPEGILKLLGLGQKVFGWNAPAVHTSAADLRALNESHGNAALRRFQSRHITAGSAAYDDECFDGHKRFVGFDSTKISYTPVWPKVENQSGGFRSGSGRNVVSSVRKPLRKKRSQTCPSKASTSKTNLDRRVAQEFARFCLSLILPEGAPDPSPFLA